MPCLDSVFPRGHSGDCKATVGFRNGMVWMIENADVGKHPRVDVTLDWNKLLGFIEPDLKRLTPGDVGKGLRCVARYSWVCDGAVESGIEVCYEDGLPGLGCRDIREVLARNLVDFERGQLRTL